jgi:hypothetical protein
MVALKPVNATLRVRLAGSKGGAVWNVLHHWKYAGTQPTNTTLNTICNSWATAWNAHMAPVHFTDVTLSTVECWDLTSPDAGYGTQPGLSFVGSLPSGTSLPANIAAVVSWKVSYRWRGGHPRTYWPAGSTASVLNARTWTSTAILSFETASNGYLGAVNAISSGGLSGHLVCVRRWNTPVRGEPPIEYDPPLVLDITSLDVDSRIDTQRRRLGPDVAS